MELGALEQGAAKNGQAVLDGITLGVGAWSWGDRLLWGYGSDYQREDVRGAFDASLDGGLRLFDTAEAYGQGQSEQMLGEFIKTTSEQVYVASKFMPFPWRLNRASLLRALRGSLRRLDLKQVDLYQIHQPLPPVNVETWMAALADALQAGLTRAVGVSNYDRSRMQRAYDTLIREGIYLASNQVEFSLLNRKVEKDGLLKHCQELGVVLIAYSPLAMGILSGKYSQENLPRGVRGARYNRKFLQKIDPLLTAIKRTCAAHDGKTPAQVALNWCICKGTLPIPGAKNRSQAEQNAGTLGWQLSADEVAELDELSDRVSQ